MYQQTECLVLHTIAITNSILELRDTYLVTCPLSRCSDSEMLIQSHKFCRWQGLGACLGLLDPRTEGLLLLL